MVIYPLLWLFSWKVVFDSFGTPWTVAHRAPLSLGFPRQEYWPKDRTQDSWIVGRFLPAEPPVYAAMYMYM